MVEKKDEFYQMLIVQKAYKKVSAYSDVFQVSTRTIYNYLNELEERLSCYEIELSKKSGLGIMLKGTDVEKNRLLSDLIKEKELNTEKRRASIYENFLMMDRTLSINALSEFYHVSRSSIVNDLKEIDIKLRNQKLYLNKTTAGTFVEGDEYNIRKAKDNFIYEKLEEVLLLNDSITIQYTKSVLTNYTQNCYTELAEYMIAYMKNELCFEMNIIYYLQTYIAFVIFIDRIMKNRQIKKEYPKPFAIEIYKLRTYPIAQQICQYLVYDLDTEIEQLDINYVNGLISSVYNQESDIKFVPYSDDITEMVIQMVDSIKSIFPSDIMKDKLLINGLEKHFLAMFNRIAYDIKITNPYIQQVKEQYAPLFSVVSLACSVIENYANITLSEDEISFILIHFQAAVERIDMSKKIIIVVEKKDAYTTILESKVRRNIVLFDVIEIVEKNSILTEYINEFDFAITTVDVTDVKIPSIQVSSAITNNELESIHKIYYESFKSNDRKRYSFMLNCLSTETILLNMEYKGMKECIEHACSILSDEDCVTDEFQDSVMRREKISPTNISDGIALPHGLDKFVLENRIVIITMRKPIVWGNDHVKVVFLLSINFSNITVTKKILNELYFCISDHAFIQSLIACQNSQEVYTLFERQ